MDERTRLLARMRRAYATTGLTEADLAPAPVAQFARWLTEAEQAGVAEPNAMVLATVGPDAQPSTRMVLLKGVENGDFVFFSNYGSGKARDLTTNPAASLLFPWHAIARQVIVTGTAERTTPADSARYFASRPRGSQLGAWASRQSQLLPGRAPLEARMAALEREYAHREVPPPPFWGGFRVAPHTVEFWQGRENRLHDRLRYRRGDGKWAVERLAP